MDYSNAAKPCEVKRDLDTVLQDIERVRQEMHALGSSDFQRESIIHKSMALDLLINEYYQLQMDIERK